MPIFGGINCTFVKSAIPENMRDQSNKFSVVGIDGHGFQSIGKRGVEYSVRLIFYDLNASVNAWIANIRSLQNQVIQYTDDFGDLSNDVFVSRVNRPAKTPAATPALPDQKRAEITVNLIPLSA